MKEDVPPSNPDGKTDVSIDMSSAEKITSVELRDRRAEILDQVEKEKKIFVIMRRDRAVAVLSPMNIDQALLNYSFPSLPDGERVHVISPVDLKDRRGELLSALENGDRFIVSRKGTPVGVLLPAGESIPLKISVEDLRKLEIVQDLTSSELKLLVQIIKDGVSLLDLVKAKTTK